jgi:hypothetical protein
VLSRYVAQVLYEWLWDGSSFPVIIGATFVFIFLVRCIFIVWFILFKIVAASFLNTVLSAETAMLVNILLIIILLPHLSPWRQCYVRTDSACVKFGGFHLKIYIPATSAFVDLQTIRHALTNFLLPNTHTHIRNCVSFLASYTTHALILRHLSWHFYFRDWRLLAVIFRC